MQKKAGQISSNTLGLRFMQNAARARQERETEAVKAGGRSEEEWVLAPEVREGWGLQGAEGGGGGQTVSYEPSYLPFLFPSSSSASGGPAAPGANGEAAAAPDDAHASDSDEKASRVVYKGRRRFGQHGREEAEENPAPAQPPPPGHDAVLPRGARSISSHGRAAASSTSSSKPPHRPPPPAPLPPSHAPATPQLPPPPHAPPHPAPAAPRGFMKPPVDAPRAGKRRTRDAGSPGPARSHGVHNTDGAERGLGGRTKKTRRE